MQQIKILIETSAGTVEELDPPRGESIKLNYSISSAENFGKRSGGFSRDIKLPPTENNIKVLGFIHEINDFDRKDVTNRKNCWVSQNGNTYIRGFARVDAIRRSRRLEYFRIRVFGDNADIKDQLDKVYLNELDYGEIKLDVSTVEDTWAYEDSDDGDYLFPLVNYGKWRGITSSLDYVTPGDVCPALFVRPFIHKCFNNIGYNVSSSFLDSTEGKRLLIPYTNPDGYAHGIDWRKDKEFEATNTSSQVVTSQGYHQILFPVENSDIGNNFDSNTFTAPKDGHWNFKFSATVTTTTSLTVHQKILFRKNGTPLLTNVFSMGANFGTQAMSLETGWMKLTEGDTIDMAVLGVAPPITLHADYTLTNTTRPEIQTDDDLNVGGCLRSDITQWKYIEGLIGLFNLYILTDTQSKTVYIEDRDNFFNAITTAADWSTKIDLSSIEDTIISTPARELVFKYKKDGNDKYLNKRNETVGSNVGEFEHTMPERFKKGKQQAGTSLYAMTYMIYDKRLPASISGQGGVGVLTVPKADRAPLVPVMWNEVQDTSDYPDQSYNFAPRILYWIGDTGELTQFGGIPLFHWGDSLSTHSARYTYPKAVSYNLDNINNDPNLQYGDRTVNSVTSQGLYSKYFFNEINNREKGVKRVCKVNLTDKDMLMLAHNANISGEADFRNLVYLKLENGQYWILSAVKDYQPGANNLTMCEFVRYLPNEAAPEQLLDPREVGGEIDVSWPDDAIDYGVIGKVTDHFTYTDNGGILVAEVETNKNFIVVNK
tara:strand:- start:1140 stop:3449 length:2310 start_codon:yes stop_codon:yes gene_type:complete